MTATTDAGVLSNRSIVARFPDPQAPSVATSSSASAATAAPTLVVPQTSRTPNPTAIPVSLIATFFQLLLNTFASGVGDTLQGIVTLLVTTGKTTLGVNQYYTMHLTGVCGGSVFNTNATNLTTPFNLTSCYSYGEIGACKLDLSVQRYH